jgi:hypothetical protein
MRLNPLLSDGIGCAPNQRPTVRLWKGKNRERASRCEEFERLALSPPSQSDLGQQGGLAEIPNVGLCSWIAIGMNQQNPGLRLKVGIRLANNASNPAVRECRLEAFDQYAMPDHIAQTGAPQVLCRNPDTAQMVTQCDFDGRDLTAFDRKLSDSLDQSARSSRNRQRAMR